MTSTRTIILGTALTLTLSSVPSGAQIVERRTTLSSEATTIEALVKRIESLENTVAQLRQQTAFIKSVNPLVLDASGAAVTVRGGQILIESATAFDARAGSNVSIRASSAMMIDAAAGLDLKGSVVKLNGGSRPVACAGVVVNGQTAPSSGPADHSHSVAVPLPGCGTSVLVPQN